MRSRSFPYRLVGMSLLLAGAFAAGMLVSRIDDGGERAAAQKGEEDPFGRNPYSATIADDPSFRAAQRRNVEALEKHCNSTGEMCPEAGAARRAFEDN